MSSIQHTTLSAGEKRELIFINEPNMHWHIVQEENSFLRVHIIYLSENDANAQWQSTLTVEQNAANCRTEIYAMGLLHESQQAHLFTRVYHNIGGGYSSQVLKFVLDDHSKGRFVGDLKIAPDAQQTIAHQTNRNLLLSDDAEMRTLPQLEIYADDVQASHGATTGQLDTSAIFYMQQRGIGKQKARQLLVDAFIKEVINTIEDTSLRQSLLDTMDGVIEES